MHECQLHKSVTLKTIYLDVICSQQTEACQWKKEIRYSIYLVLAMTAPYLLIFLLYQALCCATRLHHSSKIKTSTNRA